MHTVRVVVVVVTLLCDSHSNSHSVVVRWRELGSSWLNKIERHELGARQCDITQRSRRCSAIAVCVTQQWGAVKRLSTSSVRKRGD